MGKVYPEIDEHLRDWIARRPMFFVGTAPLAADGHVNVSPKGPIGTLRVLGPHRVAYLDIVGSGAETIAHLRDNGRIVVMLCSFDGPPRILRLHGRGAVLSAGAVDFPDVEMPAGTERAVIRVEVERIADSCGYGVPVMRFEGHRPQYEAWAGSKRRQGGEGALDAYKARYNERSIDGLPAVDVEDLEPA